MAYHHHQSIPGSASSGSSSNSGFHFLNSPFGDTTFTKVFVGGLAWETQSETMRVYFEQFGEILEAVVITDKNTGRSKGYGFVTFRDPEAARRACADPSPVIDGRRANCNLASLGRPRPPPPYGLKGGSIGKIFLGRRSSPPRQHHQKPFGRLRPAPPYYGSVQSPRGAYVGSPSYQQSVPYSYQQGFAYSPYGYTTYGPEHVYQQGVYSPYMGQQYLQVYGVPGSVNTAATAYQYGQVGQPLPGSHGPHGYTSLQGYAMPGHHIMQFTSPNASGMTAAPISAIQAPYPTGMVAPIPAQPQFLVHSPQFTQSSGSDQRQVEG